MKNLTLSLVVIGLLFTLTGCVQDTVDTADDKQREATTELMQEAERQVGMPAIANFQERKLMKMIMEQRDKEKLTTYAYITNLEGKLVYIGQCVGYGLPYSVQFTNPQKFQRDWSRGHLSTYTIPQPDPNGLFMPEGLSATWLMMLDEETGEVHPVYVEPQIIVSPFKLH